MADQGQAVEMVGKTVDDAVQRALRRLGKSRSEVGVEVLSEGSAGIFGIGAAEALVRVTPLSGAGDGGASSSAPLPRIDDYEDPEEIQRGQPSHEARGRSATRGGGEAGGRSERGGERGGERGRGRGRGRGRDRGRGRGGGRGRDRDLEPEPRVPLPFDLLADPEYEPNEDPTTFASELLTDLVHLIGFEATVKARPPETPMDGLDHAEAVLDVLPTSEGDDLGQLIGRHGSHLAALQYVVNVIVSRSIDGQHPVTVDIDGYKRRREESLNTLAARSAEQVRESGEPVELEPMPAAERRIVHLALQEDAELTTESVGEGDARRVRVVYRGDV